MAAQYLDIGEDGESNPAHDELIQHLRGFRDIVINTQHGGFGLSQDAQIAWLERTGTKYTTQPRDDRHSDNRWGPHILVNNTHWSDKDIKRDDPTLVQIVKEMGADGWGEHAELKIVRIPANVDWQIEEYDGWEWVAEAHRSWK
jgi:hypothetical protein